VTFAPLDDELARWADLGREATLWWRDDDAVAMTPALARLLGLAREHGVPVALAVVPALLEDSLADALAAASACTVVQHGFAHRNHAPSGAKPCELCADRPLSVVCDELEAGRARLREAFGERFRPIVVPPWNRIAPEVVGSLPALGCTGLSTFAPRASGRAAEGVVRCNAHVDPVAWREGRGFVGARPALDALVGHLAMRRTGLADPDEPTGLLTHHLVFGSDAWQFVGELVARTRRHPAARWLPVDDAFRR
jgi:hypothetical protein